LTTFAVAAVTGAARTQGDPKTQSNYRTLRGNPTEPSAASTKPMAGTSGDRAFVTLTPSAPGTANVTAALDSQRSRHR